MHGRVICPTLAFLGHDALNSRSAAEGVNELAGDAEKLLGR